MKAAKDGTSIGDRGRDEFPLSQTKMAGLVGMSNCRFVRCRFVQVGYTGTDAMLDELLAGVKGLTEAGAPSEPTA